MIATKFVICLLASVVVTMGFKLDKGDEGFPRREADEAQEGSPRREADETLEWSAGDAGDAVFMPTDEQTDDGSLSREADSVESENAESHNSNWIKIQLRLDMDETAEFFRAQDWNGYKNGFGSLEGIYYWMGLEKMHDMTKEGKWQLQVKYELDWGKGTTILQFDDFKVANEADNFRLTIGESFFNSGSYSKEGAENFRQANFKKFTTKDKGYPYSSSSWNGVYSTSDCADRRGGWWYWVHGGDCGSASCPNSGSHYAFASKEGCCLGSDGLKWVYVKATEMAMRKTPQSA